MQVNVKDLIDLTELASDKEGVVGPKELPGVYPSCGGCDEFMRFYAYQTTLKKVRAMSESLPLLLCHGAASARSAARHSARSSRAHRIR